METKDAILRTVRELFFKYGIKSITMDDVAKRLGISKKTIYRFFYDKDDLVKTLIEEIQQENKQKFKKLTTKAKNAVEEILVMMKQMSILFSQMNPNFIYDLQKYHSQAWLLFRNFKDKYVSERVEENLLKGMQEGLFRKNINVRVMAKLRIEELEIAMDPEIFPATEYSIGDIQVQLLDHFLHGICTLKGHKLVNKYKELKEEED